jgi:hypothetical protein
MGMNYRNIRGLPSENTAREFNTNLFLCTVTLGCANQQNNPDIMVVTSIAIKCNLKGTFNKQSVCFKNQVDHDG